MSRDRAWTPAAWNGIRCTIPLDWHPAVIEPLFLLFENQRQPVCRLRWQFLVRPRGPDKITAAVRGSLAGLSLNPLPLPWPQARLPRGYTASSHRYRHDRETGILLILLSEKEDFVFLIQFPEPDDPMDLLPFLASLERQPVDAFWEWRIFDFRLLTPPQARLATHEFLPGSFRISCTWQKTVLTYFRFKPADILLEKSLVEFGRQLADGAPLVHAEPDEAQWERASGPLLSLAQRLGRRFPHCRLWLRHIRDHNGIVALRAQGNTPLDSSLFSRLCSSCLLI